MRRSRLLQALLLSLALHLGLGLLLYLAPPSTLGVSSGPSREPIQFEVVERTPPPGTEPPRPTPPPPAPQPTRPPRSTPRPPPRATAPPATPPPGATAAAPPPSESPPATPPASAPPEVADSPRSVRLYPGPGGIAVGPSTGNTPGFSTGHTLRPGDGPSSEQLRAEEHERVQGRVQGMLDDGMATLRVRNGLVDPYFGDMDNAMEKGLSGAPLFAYEGVLKHFFKASPGRTQAVRDILETYGHYGATGGPDAVGEPSGTDRLEDVARAGTAGARARSRPSTMDTLEAFNKSTGALRVELDLEQSPSGQVLSVKLSRGSGNPLFDAYVVEHVPESLAKLGPASEHFSARAKGATVRSAWSIDGRVSFSRTIKFSKLNELEPADAAYFSGLAAMGILAGNFEETRGEIIVPDFRRPHFDIHTELLRVY